MHNTRSLAVVLGLLACEPAAAELPERSYLATCDRDSLCRSFLSPRYSASASAFCSNYIRSTVSAIKTITATAASTPLDKRSLSATTAFPRSRLSNACSCILTATPKPTTVYATTKTVTKAQAACTDVKTIVPNGDFETGSLAPWLVLFSAPNLQDQGQYFSYNVTSPGYNSRYGFTMTENLAGPFVEVDIGQIEVPVCPGRKYKISAQVFITGPKSDQLLQLYAEQALVAQAPEAYIQETPVVWRPIFRDFHGELEDRSNPGDVQNYEACRCTVGC